MPIFRFFTYANKEVFDNNIDPTAVYGERARKKLVEIPKQLILPTKDLHEYAKSNGVGFDNEVFGNSLEFYVWENLTAKLVAHPQIDTTFTIYTSKQPPAPQEQEPPQEDDPAEKEPSNSIPAESGIAAAEEDIGDKHPFPSNYVRDQPPEDELNPA